MITQPGNGPAQAHGTTESETRDAAWWPLHFTETTFSMPTARIKVGKLLLDVHDIDDVEYRAGDREEYRYVIGEKGNNESWDNPHIYCETLLELRCALLTLAESGTFIGEPRVRTDGGNEP